MFKSQLVEGGKIVLLCICAAILYGLVHDQITTRIYLPYFTVYHPSLIDSQNPTIVGLFWGFVATWWVGLILGIMLAVSSRAGEGPHLSAKHLAKPVAILIGVIAIGAALSGTTSFLSEFRWRDFQGLETSEDVRTLTAVWVTHNASYGFGFLGGIVLTFWAHFHRRKLSRGANY